MSGLPRGWVEAEAAEICGLVQSGGTPKEGFVEKPGIPFLKVYNIVNQIIDFEYRPQFITVDVHQSSMSKSQAVPGDVLMNIVGPPLGKVAVIPPTFPSWNLNQALTIFRPSSAVTSEWLYFFLCGGESVKSVINETRGSAGQVNISLSQCRKFGIPLPPLAEQKRIVAKLGALNAKSARARTELSRIETLVSRYKQAVLSKAFSGELTAPGVQPEWPVVRLGEIAEVGTGATPKRGTPLYYSDGTVPWITSGAVNQGQILEAEEYITEIALRETNCKIFPAGTLVIAMYGEGKTRGKVAVLGLNAATNQALAAVQIRDVNASLPRYVFLFLQSVYFALRDEAAGGVQPNLNLSIIKLIELPMPPMPEQHEIVRRIESAFAKIDRLAVEAKRALKLLGKLDEAILAKAFRGELVPQDENDEPAEKLLERIHAEREAAPKAKRGRGRAA